ncbi:hypothetical protein IC614_10300 [Allosphingosinicella flava]|uniref:Uncharacterized protein n=1 Tax=Allosphingosinicella flava TaxID=2771430 RepID=A0A7T2GJ52_9SPHN|nr:hypothetical protein [Sphingosinicella flava]QPQ54707.1 hypothetical protein IC614_10300 [Sphingosinicella flava]
MRNWLKILIGLLAVLLVGWLHHGPLGHGEAYVAALEQKARAVVAETGVPGVSVALGHDPLTRHATLSGPADAFQREGQGELKGINDLVGEIEGVSGIGWTDEGKRPFALPLLAELWIWMAIAYLAGLGLGWLLFRPREREGFF